MTTRKELLGHVRKAIKDELDRQDEANTQDECSVCGHKPGDYPGAEDTTEMAFAAIEAVYKAIGDHQLAVMIGDTEARPARRVVTVEPEQAVAGIELLQDDDEEDQ